MPADRNLAHLAPGFREKVEAIIKELDRWCSIHRPGTHALMIEGFRTSAYQQELYAKGRTKPGEIVTYRNGTTNPSNHQSSLAADIVIATRLHGTINWGDLEFFAYLGHVARANGLVHGGDWKRPDLPHIEWPESDKATYKKAREWQKVNGLR